MSILEIPAEDRREHQNYPLQVTRLHKNAHALAGFLFGFGMVLEVDGAGNFPRAGGVVVAANHLTNYDAFPLQLALNRPLFYMAKADLFQNPFLRRVLRSLGAFPVYRGARDEWALDHARHLLEAGQAVGIFPEGTRSQGRGLKVAQSGAARLALSAGCPLLPVTIEGTQHLFKGFPRRTRVRVSVCEPIQPRPDELPLALTDRLMFTLAQNLPPHLRGVYAESPTGF